MSNGIRITRPTDFMGNPLATEKFVATTVEEKVAEVVALPEGIDSLIDPSTGKLNAKLNPGITLPEGIDSLIDPDTGKLDEKLNPGITVQMNGVTVEHNATKVNFIGNCMVVTDGNGFITARIGDNLNSSNFNTEDGQTNGVVSKTLNVSTTSAYPAKDRLTNEGTSTVWLSNAVSGNKVTLAPAGAIHFDNTDTHFEVVILHGKEGSLIKDTYYLGKVAANGSYTAKKESLTGTSETDIVMTISGFKAESKADEGATGYEGSVSISININGLLAEDTDFKVAVRHVNGAEGTKYWGITAKTVDGEVVETYTDSYIHFIKDLTTKPAVASTAFALSGATAKQLSGVSYLTGGTVTVTASGITNLAVPAAVATKISASGINGAAASSWCGSFTQQKLTGFNGNSTDSVAYEGTASLYKTGQYANASVQVAGINVNGTGAAKAATTPLNLLIDKETVTAPSATKEYFATETDTNYPRYKNNLTTKWVSSWPLTGNEGSEGLQLINGTLRYPTGNYVNTNNGLASIVGSSQPNYSSATGDRSYVRYFVKTGSLSGGTFTIGHTASIATYINEGTLNIEVSKGEKDDSGNVKWYDISRISGIGTAFNYQATESTITFEFTDGVATGGMWFRLRMASSSVGAVIKSIVLA